MVKICEKEFVCFYFPERSFLERSRKSLKSRMQFPLKSWSKITTSRKRKKIELKNLTFIEYQSRHPLICPDVMSNFALENENVFLRANSFKL